MDGLSCSANVCSHLTHAILSPPQSIAQTACQSVQLFLHSSWQKVPILDNGPPLPPQRLVTLSTYRRYTNQTQSEYKHVLANILRSLFVARPPSEEARSPDRHSNVENAPPPSPANYWRASHAHFPYTARNFENAPFTHQSAASSGRRPRPAGRSHYVVISRDGRKLVTRVRVMLP